MLGIAFALCLRAQDFSQMPAYNNAAAVAPANPPQSSTDPGTEGQIALDDNYLYTYHNGVWKKSQRLNL